MTTTQSPQIVEPRPGPAGGAAATSQRLTRLMESLPPHALEAEMCLIGSVLLEPRALGDVTFLVRDASDFYKPANGAIYQAMVELYDAHASLDIVQLAQRLVDRDILDAVGGQDYLVELASCVPTAAVWPFTATTVWVSPASGSMSLESTPGAATINTWSSPVAAVSFSACGPSLAPWIVRATVAEDMAPALSARV